MCRSVAEVLITETDNERYQTRAHAKTVAGVGWLTVLCLVCSMALHVRAAPVVVLDPADQMLADLRSTIRSLKQVSAPSTAQRLSHFQLHPLLHATAVLPNQSLETSCFQ